MIFLVTGQIGLCPVHAQDFALPAPGTMVHLSPEFNPPILKGIKVHPDNPLRFDFILDIGDGQITNDVLRGESGKLIKYFLASLTIPEKDLWVNLSPYEKDRIVPESFGKTEMGRDLLAEDYLLKQITASLVYPESQLGKKFWRKIYTQTQAQYGTTDIPINTFNKVWIVPENAIVYENSGVAFILENHLKVMLEQDYLALKKMEGRGSRMEGDIFDVNKINPSTIDHRPSTSTLGSQIVREILIPALTKEVNTGKNFAQLRQVFNSLILATWYKKKINGSILNRIYSDRMKIQNLSYRNESPNLSSPNFLIGDPQHIYQLYLKAFKKGVYNYIKEEPDITMGQTIPRKYFSGGVIGAPHIQYIDSAQITFEDISSLVKATPRLRDALIDMAMNAKVPNNDIERVLGEICRQWDMGRPSGPSKIFKNIIEKYINELAGCIRATPQETSLKSVRTNGAFYMGGLEFKIGKLLARNVLTMKIDMERKMGSLQEGSAIRILVDKNNKDNFLIMGITEDPKRPSHSRGKHRQIFLYHHGSHVFSFLSEPLVIGKPMGAEDLKSIEAFQEFYNQVSYNEKKLDLAQISNVEKKSSLGGIDLNPVQMSMQIKARGKDFYFNFNGTEIVAAQAVTTRLVVTGATFTIGPITPVTDLLQILGLKEGLQETQLSRLN